MPWGKCPGALPHLPEDRRSLSTGGLSVRKGTTQKPTTHSSHGIRDEAWRPRGGCHRPACLHPWGSPSGLPAGHREERSHRMGSSELPLVAKLTHVSSTRASRPEGPPRSL